MSCLILKVKMGNPYKGLYSIDEEIILSRVKLCVF